MPNTSFFARNKGILIASGIVLILIIWVIGSYNSLVSQNQDVTSKWSQIDNQLQRRYDLIPNLVASVKGITKQEQTVFGDIATARTQYAGATTTDQKAVAAGQVEGALARLLVITENYPNLRSSEAFTTLMAQLEGTENRLAIARQDYNTSVQTYDTALMRFPGSLVAHLFGFTQRAYFQIPDVAKVNPQVNFQ